MNKQNISKLNFFFLGLKNKFVENNDLFKSINVVYTTGLKNFKGIGLYDNNKINYNFNGISSSYSIEDLLNNICKEAEQYDSLTLTYCERGSVITITADNKNVKMTTKENEQIEDTDKHDDTSTLLNRNYLIKVRKANPLLKAIGIMSKDGKILNDKIRKYNQIDHYVELIDKELDALPKDKSLTILDCGCGKSYLTFVLNYYLTEVKKVKCNFIGIDISKEVIKTSKSIANELEYRNMEFLAMDIKDYKPNRKINMVMSLHACDTATDMALALGIKVKSDLIIAVPCCHRELLSQYNYEPFKSITKYGILKARMADALTDGMRGLMLEAKGYNVSIVEYISPLETPKNLMIRAQRTGKESSNKLEDYKSLCKSLNASPALSRFLEEKWKS
ncbi:SAM-dependent methyltransferase [Clostridium sp. SHJSY1]|uniref:class I SAM-dependent methyltransferase n=1 Tax=Clostridium sp. SHJSY1 TaxID=2942483 RepID=UPI00287549B8|nr:SAM-dependent methyltransferase [Clostridium sp. SHJSY1]MDS0527275.1 SAM-dependent methyltransferase [Clostridium sp. SHJSY1]